MRTNQYLLSTLKEIPIDAEMISHQLMLRAGMIRRLTSGLYTWLPTGLRVLHKVESIIREEMNKAGAIEILMPVVQPADLWQKSSRWTQFGPELLRFNDRSSRPFVLGPTHEEVITNLIHNEVSSYKKLPLNFYQIQTKFRDEIRPCFGVIRSREFIMKDAYSFHTSQESLQTTYENMYQVYSIIFTRMGLNFIIVQANNGYIGGDTSHEFQVLSRGFEKDILLSKESDYAAAYSNSMGVVSSTPNEPKEEMRLLETHNICTISELTEQFNLPIEQTVKIFIVHAREGASNSLIALMLRGDHQLNKMKAEKLSQVAIPLTFASEEDIRRAIGAGSNSLGPVNLSIPLIIDRNVAAMSDFAAGANIDRKYFLGINWQRDLPLPEVADLHKIVADDLILESQNMSQIIEVGHIFKLGSKYSDAIKATVQDANGRSQNLIMGCYGIGVTRVIAAIIEQNHDEGGILWPEALAPFKVAILPINMHKSFRVSQVTEKIYSQLHSCGIDVLLDDRKEHLGVMFNDIELIGIPHIIVISDRNLNKEEIEYKHRRSGQKKMIKVNLIIDYLLDRNNS